MIGLFFMANIDIPELKKVNEKVIAKLGKPGKIVTVRDDCGNVRRTFGVDLSDDYTERCSQVGSIAMYLCECDDFTGRTEYISGHL